MRYLLRLVALTALLTGLSHGAIIKSLIGDEEHWTATKWSKADIERFGGCPQVLGPERNSIMLRYSFFVSDYDIAQRTPIWVAHVDSADAEKKARSRTGKGTRWDRGTDVFSPDANVRWAAGQARLHYVSNASYTDSNPPELNAGSIQKITRGHMASNMEMKCEGTEDEGDASQSESFSLANAAPQMQGHNAPCWAKLEDQCLTWAAKFHGVAVISGPLYTPEAGEPLPVGKQLQTDGGKDHVTMRIPTHFFKVIIAVQGGKRTAIGFLIPHRTDLYDQTTPDRGLAHFIVPVRQIELAAKINFMPDLGPNNELETKAPGVEWSF
jgi:DNA/RNA endonuclease G (NUC1)